MRKIIWMQAALLLGLAAMWSCGDDKTETQEPAVVPQIAFPVAETDRSAYVDEAVRFEAVVESPGPLDCSWYVDEKLVAATASMTYVFKAVGTYAVRFEASNTAGKVEKNYMIAIEGTPLEIEFSEEEAEIECMPGEEVLISAKVIAGDKKVVHEWKVGDEKVSATADFKHVFETMGDYIVTYRGVNADGISVSRSWTVKVDEKPLEITFSNTEAIIQRVQGSEVSITATVKNGGTGLVHEWQIDGKAVSATAEFKHTFETAGTFAIAYKGVNGKGETVTQSWTAEVAELPLKIEFSKTDATLQCVKEVELVITASVKSGGTGLVHEWKAGESVVSTTTEFKHAFAAAGTYAVAYKGVNAKQEAVTRIWTVVVSEEAPGYMFEDFETRTSLPGHFINGNAAIEGTTLQDNPYKTAVNSSNKVLRDLLLKESGTSGFFDMGFSHVANRAKYRAIRVKVYIGKNLYFPRLKIGTLPGGPNKLPTKINGKPFTNQTEANWNTLIKTDDWNVFVYDLSDGGFGVPSFENITTVQFRPLSKFDGSNVSGRDEQTNNRTVYYDDIEFLE